MKTTISFLDSLIFSGAATANEIPRDANHIAAETYFESATYRSVQATGIGLCAVELRKISAKAQRKIGLFIKVKVSNKQYLGPLCAQYRKEFNLSR